MYKVLEQTLDMFNGINSINLKSDRFPFGGLDKNLLKEYNTEWD